MDRRSIIKHAGIAGVLAAGTAPSVHAQAGVRWRLASSFPKPLDTIYGGAETFARKVGEMTGGKFQISVHAAGELMPALGVIDGVQQGSIEACHTAGYYFFGKNEAFAVGAAIPFGMNTRQLNAWMYEGNGLKLTREFYAKYNMVNFPCGNTGAQMGGWFRKEIKTVEDFKGLKFRIGGFAGRVIERLGAVPQNIPGGEIYQSLEKGTIDAAEWIGPYDDQKLGFNKVAPYYYYPGWWEGTLQLDLQVNQKAYDALTPEYKAVVQAAASHAHVDMQAKYDARNPTALKQLVGAKTKVLAFPKPVLDASFKAAMEVYAELDAKNADWKTLYADYRAFQKDQLLWSRFAEARFDSYMQGVTL
ncbi:TRAP transporter substrate-binding protein [Xylophilus ampelinus]|uniref:TRAP-type mannitol/chloroaromatic compound transport system substrate-binding protein n=1 Tax=Xylophilus ampelinus TaxID=54067 RepID=A0A318SG59_9BURK|nr:TRAP transporter substrate-binding protein [Xylophilus ampelinus]MCS4510621.1 TRAP transporter substrate-binding protein [Xylophilus ampelinus]PYE77752.1 TRAP-type mannitol/chloroaromatic compound transport system substrate-binding protein [Xylophilus ampelinus]